MKNSNLAVRNNWLSGFRPFQNMAESFFDDWEGQLAKDVNALQKKFSPSCEIIETEEKYELKFDMPGVEKNQIQIDMNDGVLTVSAERSEEKKSDTAKKHLSEVFYGSYQRSFALPSSVEDQKVDAKFENGVLRVTLPKTKSAKAKKIMVS